MLAHISGPNQKATNRGSAMAIKQLTLPGEVVKKSNDFVRSRVKLENATAGKIFTTIVSCVKPDDKDFKDYQISVSSLFPVDEKDGGSQYALVRKALKAIAGYVVEMNLSEGSDPDYVMYPLFAKAHYKRGVITAQIHPDLKPHFIQLAGVFTQYPLMQYLMLSSTYSQRLFEILSSYAKSYPSQKISLERLHLMLNTTDSLKQDFAQFRRRVLEQAHKEITAKTELEYEWSPVKKGRAVTDIQFVFSKKALEEKEKQKQKKITEQQRKYIGSVLACYRAIQSEFVDGKCPKEKIKTIKCRLCKDLDYFQPAKKVGEAN
jgi:plasmid replication initiation protein